MPELRYDPIRWRWSIIASERGLRPSDYGHKKEEIKTDTCPFCEGKESMTPREVFAISSDKREPNTSNWKVRVVPNKFPALRIEGSLERSGVGLFDYVSGIGAHEVIIETPDHLKELSDQKPEDIYNILIAFKERWIDLSKDPRFRYILVFKNYGKQAGASLSHPHSQLIATPIIPLAVVAELQSARKHYQDKERCIFCDLILQETTLNERVILKNDHFFVWSPYASSFPFETWILPLRHNHQFAFSSDDELKNLSVILGDILNRLKNLLRDPPYNFIIHTAPVPRARPGKPFYWETLEYDYHWHIEIIPRITRIAGFEWGTGFSINPTPPEEAAKYLREFKGGIADSAGEKG